MIRLIDILSWCLFIITLLPEINAKVFLIQLKPPGRGNTRSYYQTNRYKYRLTSATPEQILLQNLVSLFTPNYSEKSINRCIRFFGSIYGTKDQRQDCLKKIQQRQTKIKNEDLSSRPKFKPVQYEDLDYFDSFIDLTRYGEKQSAESSSDYEMSPKLPNYILNPNELRSKYIVSNDGSYQQPQEIHSLFDSNLRRNGSKYLSRKSYPYEALKKRNMNIETSEESKSSSSSSSSDDESKSEEKPKFSEIPKFSEKPKFAEKLRIPKRFQVVANDKWKKVARQPKPTYVETSGSSEESKSKSESSEDDRLNKSESSEEVNPKKKQAKRKPKPEKKKNKKPAAKKEFYLQGSRLVDAESDDDFRRRTRMQYFLPKRFHWDEDEIQDLGFYWFNGPQGRYPHYALRP